MEDAEITFVFPSCVHVGLWHTPDLLESRKVAGALRSAASRWAKGQGVELSPYGGVSGWTLGVDRCQTRAIYSYTSGS